jgi:hypothetical protein
MQQDYDRNRKYLFYGLCTAALLVLLVVGYGIYTSMNRAGKVAVEVSLLPKTAEATANGIDIQNGTSYLKPGTYEVVVSKRDFKTVKQRVKIDTVNKYIQIALLGETEAGERYVENNRRQYLEFESKVAAASRTTGAAFKATNPITRLLPKITLVYRIGYTKPDGENINLTIQAITPAQRQAALQQIRDWGYDPTEFTIQFTSFANPLEDQHEDET